MSAVFPTAYLPPLAYFAALLKSGDWEIEIFETYRKQSCRNHCCILGTNGLQMLSIPVVKVNGNHTLTKDIRISYSLPWPRIHWRSMETAYRNSPYFLYFQDFFHPIFQKKFDFLIDFNTVLLQTIHTTLNIPVDIKFTSEFHRPLIDEQGEILVSKKYTPSLPPYQQVFSPPHGFIPNLSIVDALFNLGPETIFYLNSI